MATKLNENDIQIIDAALVLKITSCQRQIKSNMLNPNIADAYSREQQAVEQVRAKIMGQSDLSV